MDVPIVSEARRRPRRDDIVAAAALLAALATAVGAALLAGGGLDPVNLGVEPIVSFLGERLNAVAVALPFGFAFGTGMVAAVNPCGFAMLPAYLGLYLGSDQSAGASGPTRQLGRALVVGGTMTAGFVLLFAAAGLAIAAGSQPLVSIFPWVGLAIGGILAVAGAWMLRGGKMYAGAAQRLASNIGDPARSGIRGYFLFGFSYGIASLSCTLPIFLAVVGSSLATAGPVGAVAQFVLYGLGMGLVIMTLTVSLAVFKSALAGPLRRSQRLIEPAGAVLMLVAGSYIVYYWLTIGGLLDGIG